MARRSLVPVATALLVVVAMSAASAAPAQRDGHAGVHGSISTTTPAGGTNQVTGGGSVPKSLDSVDIILGEEIGDASNFKSMTFALLQFKSKPASRSVLCAMMAGRDLNHAREVLGRTQIPREQAEAVANNYALATALMCMRIARLMGEIEAEEPARPARAAAGGCGVAPVSMKIHKERTEDGGWLLYPDGKVKDGTKALRTKVTCKGKARKLTVHMSAKKGQTIRSGVGKSVQIGLVSPSDATNDAHIKVTFKSR